MIRSILLTAVFTFVISLLGGLTAFANPLSSQCDEVARLDAKLWPGSPSNRTKETMGQAVSMLGAAFEQNDLDEVNQIVAKLEVELGDFAGVPENRPDYKLPINFSDVEIAVLDERWVLAQKEIVARGPWLAENYADAVNNQALIRLRVSQRYGRGLLMRFESGEGSPENLAEAIAVYDFIISQQSSNGVFGFPYAPNSSNALARQAAALADRAQSVGVDVVEGDYIYIDPTRNGALQFDNGVIGADLIYLYWLTGEDRFLIAAKKAGNWALTQPVSTNWNYNSFAVLLLSRLYRATGDEHYLEGARKFAEFGVLPGQQENGRWVDPHNARIQYHSVMMIGLIEYAMALRKAQMPRAVYVENRIVLGLDNLAAQINCFGVSNAHELLSLEALALGAMSFETRPAWENAMNISVNFVLNRYYRDLAEANYPLPHSLMTYRLYLSAKLNEITVREIQGVLGP